MFQARHLQEVRLFECYVAERGGEPIEPTCSEHLSDCAECYARYVDLRGFMDGLRTEADAELDDVFPAERFRAQQQQIDRRLEQLAHPARVITFPGHPPEQHVSPSRTRVATRWISAAAAAGLFLGVGLGTFFDRGVPVADTARAAIAPIGRPAAPAEPPAVLTSAPAPVRAIEQFLSELELAMERPRTPELLALDDMTPHVREIRVQLR
jgi:hypothetical protein